MQHLSPFRAVPVSSGPQPAGPAARAAQPVRSALFSDSLPEAAVDQESQRRLWKVAQNPSAWVFTSAGLAVSGTVGTPCLTPVRGDLGLVLWERIPQNRGMVWVGKDPKDHPLPSGVGRDTFHPSSVQPGFHRCPG